MRKSSSIGATELVTSFDDCADEYVVEGLLFSGSPGGCKRPGLRWKQISATVTRVSK